jgi:predicted NodU family carbamoyl transferase
MEKFDLPVLVNTSMNGRGEAICETPRQAINFCQKFDDVELVFVKDGQINLWTGEPDD